jgi:beta-lactamase regulating signal transducer with metallopeptidase domain
MNPLQHLYPGDDIASFVIRVLAEITLVTVVALIFGRVVVRNNPALRHGFCVCALLCVLAAPITTLGLQRLGWSTYQISLESEQHRPAAALVSSSVAAPERVSESQPFWTLERARDAASLIILVWLGGSAFLLFRLVGGIRKVQRIRLSSHVVEHPKLAGALRQLRAMERMPDVPIRFSHRLHGPIVVGPRETTVILPEKLLEQLSEDQLRCVLAHELTHVRQRDPLVGLVQRIVEAGYWPHPLVHILNRDLVRAREEVCDNVALHGTTAPQYANTLLTVALGITPRHSTPPGAIGLMTPPWRLEERVKGLLDPQRRLTTTMNTRHLALMAISLATGTTLIAGARIVAAPNPPSLQNIVELHARYDTKAHKIVVLQKKTQKASKTVKVVLVKKPQNRVSFEGAWQVLPAGTKVKVELVQPNTVKSVSKVVTIPAKRSDEKAITVYTTVNGTTNPLIVDTKAISDSAAVLSDGKVSKDNVKILSIQAPKDPTSVVQLSADGKQTTSVTLTKPDDVKTTTSGVLLTPQIVDSKVLLVQGKGDLTSTTTTVTTSQDGKTVTSLSPFQLKLESAVQNPTVSYTVTQDYNLTQKGDKVWTYPADAFKDKSGKTWTQANPYVYYLKVQGADKKPVTYDDFKVKNLDWTKVYKAGDLTQKDLYRVRYLPADPNLFSVERPKHKTTTVYIKGGDIRIVGDDIKVVYEKADSAKPKPKQNKPKSK